ncbi:uncharacterized protein TRIADDRAFT_19282 [Trichoplax adhaerens]|uniref:Thioredoxin n=1 Tax=Trichoplax adhaerens TaxID=10228 RepID=B3RM61_TRIAD|nr:hypothetical protein TRIADDRAFT_19282 [Trichoplax adhaerens]EDV28908.1 hypothetical protein TRIADDRAFT_19282 [Trichoplax adhaerens]|eukprot:XP_002108110.1 hypothetical protein TRIADDRAFT_19282 [Trichoplax adhaerens]
MVSTTVPHYAIYDVNAEEDFNDKVFQCNKPVVVDFHASWCGPCKVLGPLLKKFIDESKEKVDLIKVDIDEAPDIALEHEVSAVPTLLFIQNGKIVDRSVGLVPENDLKTKITELSA